MSDWVRTGQDRLERDGYRIDKSHVVTRRWDPDSPPSPVYHCHAPGGAFLGAVGGDPERAKSLCDQHANRPC